MKNILLLAVLIADGVLLSTVQNSLVKKNIRTMSDNFVYVCIIYLLGTLVMYLNGGRFECAPFTRAMGIITGFLIIAETTVSVGALKNGPMSLTNMLSMSSMVVPLIPAGILWNEPMTALQVFAAALMLLSMALILNMFGKKEGESILSGINTKWLVFALGGFVFGGLMGFPQKYQSMSPYTGELMSYLFWSFLTAEILSVPCLLFFLRGKKEPVTVSMTPGFLLGVAACGIMTAYLHILTMKAMEVIPIGVLFPVANGGRLILVTVVDMFCFRQKLTVQQLAGIAVGILAILLLSI